jgi:hypothetical protein
MSTLEIDAGDIRPVSAFTADELVVMLADGRKIATPPAWYPRGLLSQNDHGLRQGS